MKNNPFLKKSLLLVAIGALCVMMIAPAFAYTLGENTNSSTANIALTRSHPCTEGNPQTSDAFQVFNATQTGYLYNITFSLKKGGSPGAVLAAQLWTGGTGTFGTNMLPGDFLRESSDYIDASILGAGYADYTFNFSGGYQIVAGTVYAIVLSMISNSTTLAYGATEVNVGYSTGGSTGNAGKYQSSTWVSISSSYDLKFNVNGGEYMLSEDTEPLPTDGGYTGTTDQFITAFVSFLIPLVLFLLPAFLLGMMTKWAKWPILIGLAIGSGLVYMFLGTQYLWLVFLVVIGLVGMAYQGIRSGS